MNEDLSDPSDTLKSTIPVDKNEEKKEDPFDNDGFNAVHHVNKIFPDEDSLAHLPEFVDSLNTQIQRVDNEILEAVRRQSTSGSKVRSDLQQTQASIAAMLRQVAEIRHKAAQSEAMVQEICRDIKKLDIAKKHLTATITALRRLGMLITAVDQLQIAAERREFGEAAHLLGAVQQLAAHFKAYSHVPRVAEMRGRVAALELSLRGAALREFELIGEDPPSPALVARLKDCCAVAAAVGRSARDEVVDGICRREMNVYTQIFSTIGETAKLERTMNRYKWLLRRLEARREVLGVFPPSWRLPQLLCVTFCSITKTQLAEILDERGPELHNQVQNLLAAVEASHIFEAEMTRRFGGDGTAGRRSTVAIPPQTTTTTTSGVEEYDAAEVKWKYAREKARRAVDIDEEELALAETVLGSPSREEKQHHAAAEAVARASFRGSISQVFIPYLKVYVDHVERGLMGGMDAAVAAETWFPLSVPDQPILKSANELTEAVRGEMRDCSSRISRGQVLVDLSRVFGNVYSVYAAKLAARLPKSNSSGSSGGSGATHATATSSSSNNAHNLVAGTTTPALTTTTTAVAVLGSTDWQVKLADRDVEVIALIINTAEHCIEMVRQLERALAQRLDPPSLSQQVDFSQQEDTFRSLTTRSLNVLVLGVETALDTPLATLMRQHWAAVEIAGDQSEFVGVMRGILVDVGHRAGSGLPPNFFRFFCDKLLRSLAPRTREAIFRCRSISVAGCQQLRLDMEALRNALIEMAKSGQPAEDSSNWVASYAGDVAAQLAPVESVLKVVSSPVSALVDAFMELMPANSPPSEFQRIVDLKGLKRGEVSAVMEQYARRVGHVVVPSFSSHHHGGSTSTVGGAARAVSDLRRAGSGGGGGGGGGRSGNTSGPSSFGGRWDGDTAGTASARGAFIPKVPQRVASKASTSAQDVAARLRQNANIQAAKATDSMRETTGRMLGAMKSLRFSMQRDQQQQQQQ